MGGGEPNLPAARVTLLRSFPNERKTLMQTANLVLSILILAAILWSALGRPDIWRRRLRYLAGRRKAAHRVTWVTPEPPGGNLEQLRRGVAPGDLTAFDLLAPPSAEPPWPVMTDVLARMDGGFRVAGAGTDLRLYLAAGEGDWEEYRSYRADRRACARYRRRHSERFRWLAERGYRGRRRAE